MTRKRSILRTALAVAVVVLGIMVPQQASTAAPIRIMPLGDSITGSPGCWRALLWNKLQSGGYTNIDMVGTLNNSTSCGVSYDGDNEGHGGYLATNIASQNQLPGWLSSTRPDVVMMHLGTNDVWSNISATNILAAYSTLVDQMRASNPNMKILVAKIIPVAPSSCADCPQRTITLNNAIPGWASSKSTSASPIIVVDQWTGWNAGSDTGDGVHPNDSGNQKMANGWYGPLTGVLSGTTTITLSGTGTTSSGTTSGTTTSGTAPNGYPYCAAGSSSDPDGDGWGWENSASCVVRGSAAD